MELRTEIHIPPSPFKIDHHQKIYLTGSCFSENMLEKLQYFGFNAQANSHGIIYNPVSVNESLYDLQEGFEYGKDELFVESGKYLSYLHHGSFSGNDPQMVLHKINTNIQQHRKHLIEAGVIFITLGTAWVYIEVEKEIIVANCHKMPASKFVKRLLDQQEIDRALESMIAGIQSINPLAKIVFTVSPVKHLKDGFVENQWSKSLLHVSAQNALGDNIYYFPAYELMNDDLRDYRFWKDDMMHPNQLAIDYIWDKFSATYFDAETKSLNAEVKKLRMFLDHRPLSSDPNEVNELNTKKEKRKRELGKKYPQLIL
jgi:hypothetical protein